MDVNISTHTHTKKKRSLHLLIIQNGRNLFESLKSLRGCKKTETSQDNPNPPEVVKHNFDIKEIFTKYLNFLKKKETKQRIQI